MAYDSVLTPSDVALLSGNNGNNGNGGFGAWGDSAWIIIFLIFALGGWNNGNGFGSGNGNSGAADNYVLASDFATLQRQIDNASSGIERKGDYIQEQICNSDQMNSQAFANLNTNLLTNAATLNNTLATNFATTNANLMNGFAGVNQGVAANRYENQLAIGNAQNALSSQFAECCCNQRVEALQNTNALQSQLADINYGNAMNTNALQTSLAGINYNMATNTNGIQNAISNGFCTSNYNNATNTRDIVDAINASARATQDMIVANRVEDLRLENDRLRTQLNNANLAASQARQTNEIVDQIRPCPIPCYVTCNPYASSNCGCNGNF